MFSNIVRNLLLFIHQIRKSQQNELKPTCIGCAYKATQSDTATRKVCACFLTSLFHLFLPAVLFLKCF